MKRYFFTAVVRVSTVFIIVLYPVHALCASQSESTKRQKNKNALQEIEKKIEQEKTKIHSTKQKEARVLDTLNSIEKKLQEETKRYKTILNDIRAIKSKIRDSQKTIQHLEEKKRLQERQVMKRAVALYKYYRRSGLRILLSAETYNDFIIHRKLLADLTAKDFELFDSCLETLNRQHAYRNRLEGDVQQLDISKESLLRQKKSTEKARLEKTAYLKKIKQKKSMQLAALKELQSYADELQKFVDELPKEQYSYTSHGKKFSKLKGKLNYPVNGSVISTYGRKEHPELHTFTFQKGIEIAAPHGSEIKAIHDGNVVFSDWFKGFGYMIIIDHGEHYYSLSAHASRLLKKVGDTVCAGDTIALVGDTNSIKGSCLYFEIRYRGKPQNPSAWLKKRKNKG